MQAEGGGGLDQAFDFFLPEFFLCFGPDIRVIGFAEFDHMLALPVRAQPGFVNRHCDTFPVCRSSRCLLSFQFVLSLTKLVARHCTRSATHVSGEQTLLLARSRAILSRWHSRMSKSEDISKARTALLDDLDRLAKEATSVGNPKANAIALITAIRKFADIQCILSDQADVQTRRIVRLTWALVALTVALLIFTVYLYKDTHALVEREQKAQTHESKNP